MIFTTKKYIIWVFHNVKSDNMVFSKTIVLNINVCGLNFFIPLQWINEIEKNM